jgi:hypothetical protein
MTQRDHLSTDADAGCDEHGTNLDILRQDCLERASIPNLFVCGQHKIVLDVVVSKILIGADQIQELSFLFGRCEREKDFVSVSISVTKKCQEATCW